MKVPIDESTIKYKDNFHEATSEYLMTHKGKPIMIVSACSTKPYSPFEELARSREEGTNTVGQQYIFNRMKKDAYVEAKKKGGGGVLLLLGALVVLGFLAYMIFKGGGIPKLF